MEMRPTKKKRGTNEFELAVEGEESNFVAEHHKSISLLRNDLHMLNLQV